MNSNETKFGEEFCDEGKRKRDGDHPDSVNEFKRSRVTMRTPVKDKTQESESEMMAMMKTLLIRNDDMLEELKKIRAEQKVYRDEIRIIKMENENLRRELNTLTEKVEQLDRESRKKNLIITGLHMDAKHDKTIKEDIQNILESKLNIKLQLQLRRAERLAEGRYIVETGDMTDKISILKNKSMLKKYDQKIYIDVDLSKSEREKTKKLLQIKREILRVLPEEKILVSYAKLYIGRQRFEWVEGVGLKSGNEKGVDIFQRKYGVDLTEATQILIGDRQRSSHHTDAGTQ